jgi:hypothetical protein
MKIILDTILRFLPPWVPMVAVGVLVLAIGAGFLELRAAWRNEATAKANYQTALDANASLTQELSDRAAFQDEVRKGFRDLAGTLDTYQQANTTFGKKVNANASSNQPLDDGDRAALRELFGPGNGDPRPAGAVRGAGPPR